MANKNTVTLTFAGDTDKLESSFAKVEGGAGKLATSFDRSAMTVLTRPITLVVLGIAALVAIIILVVKYHKQLGEAAVAAWHGIQAAAEATWNWLKQIPGWVEGAFKSVASAISQPFRAAFN